jgi:hypothetical protein
MILGVAEHWTIPPLGYVWAPGQWETQANGTTWIKGQGRHNRRKCTVHAGGKPDALRR